MTKPARLRHAMDSTMLATDLADYLVNKGVPFREAHAMAGRAVQAAREKNSSLEDISLEAYQKIGPFDQDVYQVFDPQTSVQKRNTIGGTSLQSVKVQIQRIKGE